MRYFLEPESLRLKINVHMYDTDFKNAIIFFSVYVTFCPTSVVEKWSQILDAVVKTPPKILLVSFHLLLPQLM
jgi:hypothetical protein